MLRLVESQFCWGACAALFVAVQLLPYALGR